jgi:hypothetical protein
MTKTKGISPKLAGAIGPPLTAVVTAMILTNTVDRTSLAALASIAIGALLGYHAPAGKAAASGTEHVWLPTMSTGAGTTGTLTGTTEFTRSATSDPAGDNGDDGDDHLPAELVKREPDTPTTADAVDRPDPNHPEVN